MFIGFKEIVELPVILSSTSKLDMISCYLVIFSTVLFSVSFIHLVFPLLFLNPQKDDGTEETLTSTEFDKFLAERAAAAENLPTVSTNQSGGGDSKKKDDKNVLIA